MLTSVHISSFLKRLCLLTLICLGFSAQGQDRLIPLSQIRQEFRNTLKEKQNSKDTLSIYEKQITRLIKRGNYRIADSLLTATFNDFQKLKDTTLILQLRKKRAFMYKAQRRFPKALEEYLWLLNYYQDRQNDNELAEIYCLMAEYYRAIQDYSLMKKHLDLAEKIINSSEIKKDIKAYWIGRKGSWHTEYSGNYDSTIYYAKLSMQLAKESRAVYTEALAANELGFIYLNAQAPQDSVLKYLNHSKELLLADERYLDYVYTTNNIVRTLNQSNPTEAIRLLDEIIPLERKNNWYSALIQSLNHARYQYERVGDKEKSDRAYHDIFQARIREIQTQNEIEVNDLALTYQNQLTVKELQVQEQRAKLAEADALSNRRAFLIAVIIAILFSIISLIVFIVNRKFKKQNELLDRKSREINSANDELEKSLAQQKVLFKELNHRVKNNLSILTGLIYLQESGESDENMKNSLSNLRARIKSMALAHESLYSSEKSDQIILADYLRAIIHDVQQALGNSQNLTTKIDLPAFEMSLQQSVPLGMIMNELFTNSIKHGFKKKDHGTIDIEGKKSSSGLVINYRDDGSGYDPGKQGNTGLKLVRLLLEQLKATLEDKSSEKGFWIIMRFPPAMVK